MYDTSSGSALESVGRISKIVIIAVAAILAGFIMVRTCFDFGRSLFYTSPAEAAPGTDKEFVVTEEDTLDTLADRLSEDDIITNPVAFRVQGLLYELELYPGTYSLNTSMTIKNTVLSMDEQAKMLKENASLAESNAAGLSDDEIVGGYEGESIDSDEEALGGADQEDGLPLGASGEEQTEEYGTGNEEPEVIGGGDEGE